MAVVEPVDVRRRMSRAERDLSDGFARWRLWALTHPVRGLMDAGAAVASLVGALWLWFAHPGPWSRQLSLGVYGVSLVALFTVSAVYHAVPWRPSAKSTLQRLDHSMIFMVVAGTYTPVAVIVLDGWLGPATLGAVWAIVAVGVTHKWVARQVGPGVSITLQIVQGWFAVVLIVPLLERLAPEAVLLTLIGGVLYTLGALALLTRRPRLWPRVFSYHEVMHVFVISAAACHFAMIARHVADHTG